MPTRPSRRNRNKFSRAIKSNHDLGQKKVDAQLAEIQSQSRHYIPSGTDEEFQDRANQVAKSTEQKAVAQSGLIGSLLGMINTGLSYLAGATPSSTGAAISSDKASQASAGRNPIANTQSAVSQYSASRSLPVAVSQNKAMQQKRAAEQVSGNGGDNVDVIYHLDEFTVSNTTNIDISAANATEPFYINLDPSQISGDFAVEVDIAPSQNFNGTIDNSKISNPLSIIFTDANGDYATAIISGPSELPVDINGNPVGAENQFVISNSLATINEDGSCTLRPFSNNQFGSALKITNPSAAGIFPLKNVVQSNFSIQFDANSIKLLGLDPLLAEQGQLLFYYQKGGISRAFELDQNLLTLESDSVAQSVPSDLVQNYANGYTSFSVGSDGIEITTPTQSFIQSQEIAADIVFGVDQNAYNQLVESAYNIDVAKFNNEKYGSLSIVAPQTSETEPAINIINLDQFHEGRGILIDNSANNGREGSVAVSLPPYGQLLHPPAIYEYEGSSTCFLNYGENLFLVLNDFALNDINKFIANSQVTTQSTALTTSISTTKAPTTPSATSTSTSSTSTSLKPLSPEQGSSDNPSATIAMEVAGGVVGAGALAFLIRRKIRNRNRIHPNGEAVEFQNPFFSVENDGPQDDHYANLSTLTAKNHGQGEDHYVTLPLRGASVLPTSQVAEDSDYYAELPAQSNKENPAPTAKNHGQGEDHYVTLPLRGASVLPTSQVAEDSDYYAELPAQSHQEAWAEENFTFVGRGSEKQDQSEDWYFVPSAKRDEADTRDEAVANSAPSSLSSDSVNQHGSKAGDSKGGKPASSAIPTTAHSANANNTQETRF